ncbi:MAG: ParB/RepB/Spo0J family partition protein [Firmicutes bacterium]|nr:ParB/RepB/Spo0J family partition protein [Candidatus Colivicinus equi]
MAKQQKLGRGLSAIFGDDIDEFLDDISNNEAEVKGDNFKLQIKDVRPNPYQPRKDFDDDALKELAESIKENGVFQPILVRKSLSGYELVAGERRLRASKLAGKTDIPAILVDFNDKQMMEISLLENIQRKDLTPIEVAEAYDQLIQKLGYTQEQLAQRIGKKRENVANILRLLKLPSEIKTMVNQGKLSYGQARTLLALEDEEQMLTLARKTTKEQTSVRELEKIVKQGPKKLKPTQTKLQIKDPYIEDVRVRLERKFSTAVDISGKTISIKYNNTEDLNRILEIMGGIEEE